MSWTIYEMTEPYPEPDMQPVDFMKDCEHESACRMQWERMHGEWNDYRFAEIDDLAKLLGCCEECECLEEYHVPSKMSGTMRPAKRIIEGDGVVGSCKCESCGGSIGIRDRYCKHCGTELV